jgi:hypothetical protein
MPKRVDRWTIEHWRDGECIETIEVTDRMMECSEDGTARIVFPPGLIVLATDDELHFDADGIVERLREARARARHR